MIYHLLSFVLLLRAHNTRMRKRMPEHEWHNEVCGAPPPLTELIHCRMWMQQAFVNMLYKFSNVFFSNRIHPTAHTKVNVLCSDWKSGDWKKVLYIFELTKLRTCCSFATQSGMAGQRSFLVCVLFLCGCCYELSYSHSDQVPDGGESRLINSKGAYLQAASDCFAQTCIFVLWWYNECALLQ